MIRIPIALQAYSLRHTFTQYPLETLKKIKDAGYDGVELYGNSFSPEFYAELLKESGLVCAGWHTGFEDLQQNFDDVVRRNLAVGNRNIAVPFLKLENNAQWANAAAALNVMAEKLARYGIRLGYHNHAHEFIPGEDGVTPWDVIAQNTYKEVFMQLDTGNAMAGNADVLAELEKNAWRARTVHFKPHSHTLGPKPAIGEDDTDWEKVITFCETRGATEWIIVEYENKENPEEAICKCAAELRRLRPVD